MNIKCFIKKDHVKIFVINLIVAILCILPSLIKHKWIFMLNHDYSALNVPYTKFFIDTIKTSHNFIWNPNIDIGNNFLELLTIFWSSGRLFDLILLCFPTYYIPYLIPAVMIVKIALAALTASIYFKRYIKNYYVLLSASTLYAFSGYTIVNLPFQFFYNFIILFPLLLYSFEELIENNKRIMFLIMVCISCELNIFFFVMESIFLLIYFLAKYTQKTKPILKFSTIKNVSFEYCTGILLSSFTLIPSLLFLIKNGRANLKLPVNMWLHLSLKDIVTNIRAFFLIPQPMHYNIVPKIVDWTSHSLYIPLFGLSLCIIYIISKKDYLTKTIKLLFLFALINVLNQSFTLFSSTIYHRWFFMFILLIVLATSKVLEEKSNEKTIIDMNKYFVLFILLFIVCSVFMILAFKKNNLVRTIPSAVFLFSFTILSHVAVIFLYTKFKKPLLYKIIYAFVAASAIISANFVIYFHQLTIDDSNIDFEYGTSDYSSNVLEYLNTALFLEKDIGPYRYRFIDNNDYYCYYNIPMINDLPSTNSFTSSVNPGIDQFYKRIGYPRGIFSHHAQDEIQYILGVKYVVSYKELDAARYKLIKRINKYFSLYEIVNPLPIAFAYDTYTTLNDFNKYDRIDKGKVMLTSLVVEDSDVPAVSNIISNDVINISTFDLTESIKKHTSGGSLQKLSFSNNTYSIQYESNKTQYLFMSIPYTEYWVATNNNSPTKLLNINGLMAVELHQGDNTITIQYRYYPLQYAILLTLLGLILLLIYSYRCFYIKSTSH